LARSMSRGEMTWGHYNGRRVASAAKQFTEYVELSRAWKAAGPPDASLIPSPAK
jgi:hypothetical protein